MRIEIAITHKKLLALLLLAAFPYLGWTQQNPKPQSVVTAAIDSAWAEIANLAENSKNKNVILPAKLKQAQAALSALPSAISPNLAAVVSHSGGITIDDEWIRILGSGHEQLKRSVPEWNKNKTGKNEFLLVADDALGGFFALNYGKLGTDTGKIYYFSPKKTAFIPLNKDYKDFLEFCFNGDLTQFYAGMRWKSWRTDVKNLGTDNAYVFLPFLWRNPNINIEKRIRQVVSVEEKYMLSSAEIKQLEIK